MGALPLADITIYYIDIRAFGKGYDEFFEQAKGMGVRFVKGKVAKIEETVSGNLVVRYEDVDGDGGLPTRGGGRFPFGRGGVPRMSLGTPASTVDPFQEES